MQDPGGTGTHITSWCFVEQTSVQAGVPHTLHKSAIMQQKWFRILGHPVVWKESAPQVQVVLLCAGNMTIGCSARVHMKSPSTLQYRGCLRQQLHNLRHATCHLPNPSGIWVALLSRPLNHLGVHWLSMQSGIPASLLLVWDTAIFQTHVLNLLM